MKIKICPKCGSTEIEDVTHSALFDDARTFKCSECGFVSKIFPEVEKKNLGKIKKKIN